jgi:hypothetical protein
MARGSVNLFEQHVEKIALGLGAVFLLLMVYMYLLSSPNRVDYGGRKVTPTGLDDAIQQDSDALKKALDKAPVAETDVPDYSGQLTEQHSEGLFGDKVDAQPLVPLQLPLAADFGPPIPNMSEEQEEGQSDIVLVPPLAPAAPVLRSGRNLVFREPGRLMAATGTQGQTQPASEPVELAWISVAAYFDRAAQQNAMTKAGYATYLSKIYVAGVDVQRQEVLADGRYSGWQDVKRSPAMPQVDIPDPEVDAATGAVVNRDAINQAFLVVKGHQQSICQPPFYRIEAGVQWRMPPLDGYPDTDEDQPKVKKPKQSGEPDTSDRPPVIHTGSTASAEREGRARADDALKRAEEAYRKSEDDQAQRSARDVIDNEFASHGTRNKARAILHSIELLRQQAEGKNAPRSAGPAQESNQGKSRDGGRESEPNLVCDPNDPQKLALWFHDDSVEAGKTYRYRMRVKLWNRYVTKFAALKDPEQGKQAILLGDWSLPSEPKTVTPAAYFFVTSAFRGRDTVTATVYKWHKGALVHQLFRVGVGDLIGNVEESDTGILDRQTLQPTRETVDYSTGALVLDLRFEKAVVQRTVSDKSTGEFNLRDVESAVLVYLDPADGRVKQRVERFDRYDPKLRALRAED